MLGADEAVSYAEGDEQSEGGLDEAFVEWRREVLDVLRREYGIPEGKEEVPEDVALPPKWVLEFADEKRADITSVSNGATHTEGIIPRSGAVMSTLVENRRVTPATHWQDVRELHFELDSPVSYVPGDTASIMPLNPPDTVEQFLSLQDWPLDSLDRPLSLMPTPYLRKLYPDTLPSPPLIPVQPLTLRNIVAHHLDLLSIPRRSFFAYMHPFTPNKLHQDRLAEFVDPANLDDLWDYTRRPKRTVIEVLQEFNSVKLDWRTVLDGGFPIIHPRLFSIASCSGEIPVEASTDTTRHMALLVAILQYKTVIKTPRRGLATTYLASLQAGSRVSIVFGHPSSAFTPPEDTPCIMIAAGTGIAPMRSLIFHRHAVNAPAKNRDLLFYGGRGPDVDFYYSDIWEKLGITVRTAWSRVEGKRRRYVQDEMVVRKDEIRERIEAGAWILICGKRGGMSKAVREVLDKIIGTGTWDRLEKEGRTRVEVW